MIALTRTQQQTIAYVREHGGRLCRWPGGFWTTPDTKLRGGNEIGLVEEYDYDRHGAPVWYISIQTLRALERKGVLEREGIFRQEWNDVRRLTWCRDHQVHHGPCAELDQ